VNTHGFNPWTFQLAAEPSSRSDDRSVSILVSDRTKDGDVLVRGEVEELFTSQFVSGDRLAPVITPRAVVEEGTTMLREIVAAG
jgi:hypothetical protein